MNIIFIDDDKAAHTYHSVMLADADIGVTNEEHFYKVQEALDHLVALINKGESDLWPHHIFIDLNMPMQSGYDFVEAYEQLKHPYENPSIVLVSSTKSQRDIDKIRDIPLITGFEEKFLEIEYFQSLVSKA